MPVAVSYPGVYVEEIPSGVRTITGVATSIAAFVDFFAQGPIGPSNAVRIFSFADFERQFGGLDSRSEASYAIQQFFLNGGSQAYVIRVTSATAANAAQPASITLEDSVSGGSKLLVATAASAGEWGNTIRIDVDYATTDPTKLFNLTVTQYDSASGSQVVKSEKFLNLVVDSDETNDAATVVNGASQLITLKTVGTKDTMPAPSGTTTSILTAANFAALGLSKTDTVAVSLGTGTGAPASVGTTAALGDPVPADFMSLAARLQSMIRKVPGADGITPALPNATVSVIGSTAGSFYLVARAGSADPSAVLALADGSGKIASGMGFQSATSNIQQYALGGVKNGAATDSVPGGDGKWDPATDAAGMAGGLIGDSNAKTGMNALLDVDLFNILCIPATINLPDSSAALVASDAIALCTQRRAMYVLDAPQKPQSSERDTVPGIMGWLDQNASLRSRNAALYFPRMDIADPLNGYRLRKIAPSGTVAGLYARTDSNRGVWKAPAGTEASLSGVQKLEYKLTDAENGVLNPLAINCLRNFPIYGPVCWGARTLAGADQIADDYKYIPVRRLALYIEESLFRGTQWVVFEPNASPLWAQVRLNVGAFMQNLFRQGAFFGTTPQEAYFVVCDSTNNPQNTINLGIINIAVGFAPLKPAEFVIIQIQQIAGQIAS
jgi:phage tail sheath protein FI